jgi:hypothetical protein
MMFLPQRVQQMETLHNADTRVSRHTPIRQTMLG